MYFDFSKDVREYRMYFIGKYLAKVLTYVVYKRLTVKGKDNIPHKGCLIIASNHIAFSDPAIIVANCTRTVHFMAKSELFENPLKAVFMRNMNAFPVKRNQSDRNSLRYAKKILDNNWVLGIFPEGRRVRSSPPSEPKSGVAYLAKTSGADVLPVCIYRNPKDNSLWHSLVISYGEVIKNSELGLNGKVKSSDLEKATGLIMKKITKLWEAENEGNGS